MSTTITTEQERTDVVADIKARVASRDANKPPIGRDLSVHEFGTAILRHELLWAEGVKLPFELHEGTGLAAGLVEVETYG